MKSDLKKGLNAGDKDVVESEFNTSVNLRSRLVEVLESYKMNKINEMSDKKIFDTPSWSHKQAHSLGYCEAIKDLILILK